MLNLTDIAKRIAQPHLCSSADAEDLRLLCEKYPYSQVFPMLYLSTLAHSNDVHFDQELTKHAYKISDRTRLYQLITEKNESHETVDYKGTRETERLESKEAQVEEEIVELLETDGKRKKEEEIAEQDIIDEVNGKKEEEIKGVLPTIEMELPSTHAEPLNTKVDSFTDEITAQTIAASYSLEQEELRWKLEKTEEASENINLSAKKIIDSSFEKSVDIESKKSFSSWLHANENDNVINDEKIEVNELISKFIENSPKISQPNEKLFEGRKEKKEFFSPTKKAKESLSEHQLPVSETLAKIFSAQGNFPKAIFAYEQLMLIIPEKKIFFANQIKELQKKLNQ